MYPETKYRIDAYGEPCLNENVKKIPETIFMDQLGSLTYWFKDAMNKKRWA